MDKIEKEKEDVERDGQDYQYDPFLKRFKNGNTWDLMNINSFEDVCRHWAVHHDAPAFGGEMTRCNFCLYFYFNRLFQAVKVLVSIFIGCFQQNRNLLNVGYV